MPSFDFVSEADLQVIDDAVNQVPARSVNVLIFRGGNSEISFKRQEKKVYLTADDDYKLRAMHQLLEQNWLARMSICVA